MSQPLVLSLFPGIGLLDRAFEEEGFTIVRGPDVLWGGDVRSFHPPTAVFDGVIGGPPCQAFSGLSNLPNAVKFGNLVPEFERCVVEARPNWFVMENVQTAPIPASVDGYLVHSQLLNNRWLGEDQNRLRRISFGTKHGALLRIQLAALESSAWASCVTAAHGGERKTHYNKKTKGKIQRYTVERALELQGLPADFFGAHSPFKRDAQLKMIANGVPLSMGRAIAVAVKRVIDTPSDYECSRCSAQVMNAHHPYYPLCLRCAVESGVHKWGSTEASA